jgi:glycosyltransferase involved in cell wall biosynthesis
MDAKELMEKNLTIIVLDQENITDFGAERNAQLAKVKTPWVLFVDSDEKITPELKEEILAVIKADNFDAFYLRRLDTFLGRQLRYGETGHAQFVRLARADFGRWERPVHEQWVGKGKIGTLHNPLLHTPHTSIATFLDKINRYSTLEAEYRYQQGIKSSLFKIAIYPFGKFKWNYLAKLGFLDGVPGAIMAIMMSFHSYLTWTKLYLLWHKK